jgi:hypothetical protein
MSQVRTGPSPTLALLAEYERTKTCAHLIVLPLSGVMVSAQAELIGGN